MKRILSLLLCAVLLAACSPGPQSGASGASAAPSTVPMGRWTESEVRLNDENATLLQAPVRQADGTLALLTTSGAQGEDGYTYPGLKKWTSAAGDVWQEEAMDWPEGQYVSRGTISENGDLLYLMYQPEEEKFSIYLWEHGGTPRPMTFEDPQIDGRRLSQFGFFDNTTMYCVAPAQWEENETQLDRLLLVDLATGATRLEKELDNSILPGQAVGNEALYYVPYGTGSRTLECIDAKGTPTQKYADIPSSVEVDAGAFDAEGNYYFAGHSGVHRIAKDGNILETIFEGGAFSFVPSGKMIDSMCRTADGDFLLSILDIGTYTWKLYRYHFDETLPSVNETQITVWSAAENATVRAALVAFAGEHPEITVNYAAASVDEAALGLGDVLRKMNTELLSGKGPDVLIFDEVNYQPYVDKSLLEDLSGAVDLTALKPEIAEAFQQDGKVYVLPARFSVPILFGDPGEVESLTTLEALQAAVLACPPRPDLHLGDAGYYDELPESERYALAFLSVEQLVDFALRTSAPALTTGKTLDEDAVRTLLAFIQAVGKYYGLADYRDEQLNNLITASGDGGDTIVLADGAQEYSSTGNARYGWEELDTPAVLGYFYRYDSAAQKKLPVNAIVQPGLTEGPFTPKTLVGVNAASPHKEAALAFAAKLFSPEIQDEYYLDGTAVRTDSFEAALQRNQETIVHGNFTGDVAALYAGIKTPVLVDPTVQEKITAHAEALCAGSESLDEAVAGVKNDLALYFAEQN